MKIAFLIRDYSPSRGGQEMYLSRLSAALAAHGHDIHVFAARGEEEVGGGVRLRRVPCKPRGSFLGTLCFIRKARAALRRERFDIVSGLTRFYPLDVYRMGSGLQRVWLRKKAERAPHRLVSYLRPFTWLALFLEKRMFDPARCRHIIANSRLCRGQLLSLYGYPQERVTVVYNGVEGGSFHPGLRAVHRGAVLERLKLPAGAPVALFVANNLRRKGADVVIRALSLMRGQRLSLLIVGRGCAGPLLAQARGLGVAERIRFIGHVPDVRPYYGASDFLALPTLYDPFANVCLEAMACGLPVITTSDNGASEIIAEGSVGFILGDGRDAAALALRMESLMRDDLRSRMGAAAREASHAYTVERNALETIAVYRRVMEERDERAR